MSFAYRPNRNRDQALAVAGEFSQQGYHHWLSHDLENAFGSVCVTRLLEIIGNRVPCRQLRDLLQRVLPPQRKDLGGIKQGGPLSGLAQEIYLDAVLDRPFRQLGHDAKLIRYSDDILVLARCRKTALAIDEWLRDAFRPTGLKLKEDFDDAYARINKKSVSWLGFKHRRIKGCHEIRQTRNAYRRLELRFIHAHGKPSPALRADAVLTNWLGTQGPAAMAENRVKGSSWKSVLEA